jgi:hypothetical protein
MLQISIMYVRQPVQLYASVNVNQRHLIIIRLTVLDRTPLVCCLHIAFVVRIICAGINDAECSFITEVVILYMETLCVCIYFHTNLCTKSYSIIN